MRSKALPKRSATAQENNPQISNILPTFFNIGFRGEKSKINVLENLQNGYKAHMFHPQWFQQVLNKMLKTHAAFPRFLKNSTPRMWKTGVYTLSIHTFHRFFNIFSRSFHYLNPLLPFTQLFQLSHIFSKYDSGKALHKKSYQKLRCCEKNHFAKIRFHILNSPTTTAFLTYKI